ncbi:MULTISPECIES: hypothetical protein [Allobacillus]|uniref:Uncharacterized protein n=1 Tax=Allobacillus salarius TaxID=1955272 RepID=A0A556PPE5_9BACI|nr:hypothetical protein [Allobacillus salarius]TSJ66256.1 hypothetical protein FPQ13_05160 [Allobacillus salarius]
MFTKKKSLILSIVVFAFSILNFIFSPNIIDPGLLWIISTGLLVIVSVLLFCNYLKLKYGFNTAKLAGVFIAITISIILALILLLWVLLAFNMN